MTNDNFGGPNFDDVPAAVAKAHGVLTGVLDQSDIQDRVLRVAEPDKEAQKYVRKEHKGDAAAATIGKIGSNLFAKKRPDKGSVSVYRGYVDEQMAAGKPLLFRIPVGPIKNMNLCGLTEQRPDIAEYLMFAQLARFSHAIASIYPHGVQVQIVPDSVRSEKANGTPKAFSQSYINGLSALAAEMGVDQWIQIEHGQQRLWDHYNVDVYTAEAEAQLIQEMQSGVLAGRWRNAVQQAGLNFRMDPAGNVTEQTLRSAWDYMEAHRSEILSGMWAPGDSFPVLMANHPNSYQLFTMGDKRTQLPWQIKAPVSLLDGTDERALLPSILVAESGHSVRPAILSEPRQIAYA